MWGHGWITIQRIIQWYVQRQFPVSRYNFYIEFSRKLWKAGAGGVPKELPIAITFSMLGIPQDANIEQLREEEALSQALIGTDSMKYPSLVGAVIQANEMAIESVDDAESLYSTWTSVLNKLQVFTEISAAISEVWFSDLRLAYGCLLHYIQRFIHMLR